MPHPDREKSPLQALTHVFASESAFESDFIVKHNWEIVIIAKKKVLFAENKNVY